MNTKRFFKSLTLLSLSAVSCMVFLTYAATPQEVANYKRTQTDEKIVSGFINKVMAVKTVKGWGVVDNVISILQNYINTNLLARSTPSAIRKQAVFEEAINRLQDKTNDELHELLNRLSATETERDAFQKLQITHSSIKKEGPRTARIEVTFKNNSTRDLTFNGFGFGYQDGNGEQPLASQNTTLANFKGCQANEGDYYFKVNAGKSCTISRTEETSRAYTYEDLFGPKRDGHYIFDIGTGEGTCANANGGRLCQLGTKIYPKDIVKQTQEIVYINSQYGFSLTFPQTWEQYTTTKSSFNCGAFCTRDAIDFGFSVQNNLFNISVHTKNQWQEMKSTAIGPTPGYLGENSKYVFGYSIAHEAYDEIIFARMQEIKNIVKTFKIEYE